jgi:DNA-binding response OmpR family regulator
VIENHQQIFEQTKRLSLLFVEDNEPFRTRIVGILEDYFFRVDIADNGLDGLKKYNDYYHSKQKHYDLVISDIRMPHLNGVEFTTQLRAIREDQPVIILSAHTEADYLLSLINIGIAQFITKPIQYPQMFDTLYKVCSKINQAPSIAISPSHIISFSHDVYWDNEKRILIDHENSVAFTKYEILLMELLTDKFEQVCSTDDILNHFYLHNIDVSADNLRGMMMRLRKKLPDKALASIYGMGYRLSAVN